MTSPYYPQGNGINESSHRLLEHVIKTSLATGETPAALVFGQDLVLPGWQDYSATANEEERVAHRRSYHRRQLLQEQLNQRVQETRENILTYPENGNTKRNGRIRTGLLKPEKEE
eukprot:GHVN01091917.1.p1 GENE.GHVN01091917.1~~GHVN01091917.1.p1  ORF type:complete len:115 (+),score=3.83 GHVN01091917.1:543-887(+)